MFYLYSAIAPVSYNDVPINIHRYTSGSIELAVSFTIWTKFQYKLSFKRENLTREIMIKIYYFKSSESILGLHMKYLLVCHKITLKLSFKLSKMLYLNRVVMEVCHNDFIVFVHCCKVWTFRKEIQEQRNRLYIVQRTMYFQLASASFNIFNSQVF